MNTNEALRWAGLFEEKGSFIDALMKNDLKYLEDTRGVKAALKKAYDQGFEDGRESLKTSKTTYKG
jgi:hypothetical protein